MYRFGFNLPVIHVFVAYTMIKTQAYLAIHHLRIYCVNREGEQRIFQSVQRPDMQEDASEFTKHALQ